jgi:hypothetical protein
MQNIFANIVQFISAWKEVRIETFVELRCTYKLQNLKSKNKEILIKTEMDKYSNNEINRWEFMKNVCYTFLSGWYLINT